MLVGQGSVRHRSLPCDCRCLLCRIHCYEDFIPPVRHLSQYDSRCFRYENKAYRTFSWPVVVVDSPSQLHLERSTRLPIANAANKVNGRRICDGDGDSLRLRRLYMFRAQKPQSEYSRPLQYYCFGSRHYHRYYRER